MRIARLKTVPALIGGAAILAAIGLCVANPTSNEVVAGGSGDSATGTQYTSPVVPAMSVNPTNMSLGATATATTSVAPVASVAAASPTVTASKPAGF